MKHSHSIVEKNCLTDNVQVVYNKGTRFGVQEALDRISKWKMISASIKHYDLNTKEKMLKSALIIMTTVVLIVISPCLFSQDSMTKDYKIGPKDLLEIFVYGLQEFNNFPARVSEDGNITLPHLGQVPVEGLSDTELEGKLRELFLNYNLLQDPQVIVNIAEYQSKVVYVDGAVRESKPYELIGSQTLMQIITRAGGLTSDAGDKIYVFRTHPDGTRITLTISIDDLYMKGDADLDIPLQPGDSVHIPIDRPILIYVRGQVRRPGAIEVKMSNIPTLSQAIAAAGGFDQRASKGSIQIHTKDENGKPKIIKVNIKDIEKGKIEDIQLKENDVVIVPESFF